MNILIDAYQQHRLHSTGGNPNVTDNVAELDELRRKVEALSIACQALWEIIQEANNMDESAILARMQEIDGRDGKLDGKATPAVLECPQCARPSNASRTVCLYCGGSLSGATESDPAAVLSATETGSVDQP